MYCPNCGHELNIQGANFCHICGYDLSTLQSTKPSDLYRFIDVAIHQKDEPKVPKPPVPNPPIQDPTNSDLCNDQEPLTINALPDPPVAADIASTMAVPTNPFLPDPQQFTKNLLTFRRVSFKDRLLARLYDTMIYWVFYFLLAFGLTVALIPFPVSSGIASIIAYVMFLLRDGFNGGAGFGKSRRNIFVLRTDTVAECTYGRSIVRNIVSEVSILMVSNSISDWGWDFMPVLSLLLVITVDLWRVAYAEGGRRVGDIIAGTRVVYWQDYVDYLIEQDGKKQ